MSNRTETDQIEYLPWGPGEIRLNAPLELEIIHSLNSRKVEVFSEVLQSKGEGPSYEDAIVDFACNVEVLAEELFQAPQDQVESNERLRTLFDRISEVLPDEIWESFDPQ